MLSKNKKIAIVITVFILLLSIMQFSVPNIIGYDGYYHIKTADIIWLPENFSLNALAHQTGYALLSKLEQAQ